MPAIHMAIIVNRMLFRPLARNRNRTVAHTIIFNASRLVLGSILEFQNNRIADRTIAFLSATDTLVRAEIVYDLHHNRRDLVYDGHGLGV